MADSESKQLFGKQSNWMMRTLFFGLPVFLLVLISAAVAFDRSDYVTDVGHTLSQPVPFSHKHHAGQLQISCIYCHNQAQTSRFAQIPSTQVCAGCHREIWPESPTLQPVLESARSGEPLIWQKVTRIPEYVYFNHQVHVNRLTQAQNPALSPAHSPLPLPAHSPAHSAHSGEAQTRNACTFCHGKVEEMPLTSLAHPMTMAFCLNCHRNPPAYLKEHSIEVLNAFGLESKMDCVTCHR